jgi:hypothetical protein
VVEPCVRMHTWHFRVGPNWREEIMCLGKSLLALYVLPEQPALRASRLSLSRRAKTNVAVEICGEGEMHADIWTTALLVDDSRAGRRWVMRRGESMSSTTTFAGDSMDLVRLARLGVGLCPGTTPMHMPCTLTDDTGRLCLDG